MSNPKPDKPADTANPTGATASSPFANSFTQAMGNMNEGMEFMRRLWGGAGFPNLPSANSMAQMAQGMPKGLPPMGLPSMMTPTLDVDELDRRIADLRAVERWLDLNASMLRTTIQSLEVQRNTIATLKSFGSSMLASLASGLPEATKTPPSPANKESRNSSAAPHKAAQDPRDSAKPNEAGSMNPANQAFAAMSSNANAWWSALHDQFSRVAAAAAATAQPAANATNKTPHEAAQTDAPPTTSADAESAATTATAKRTPGSRRNDG